MQSLRKLEKLSDKKKTLQNKALLETQTFYNEGSIQQKDVTIIKVCMSNTDPKIHEAKRTKEKGINLQSEQMLRF